VRWQRVSSALLGCNTNDLSLKVEPRMTNVIRKSWLVLCGSCLIESVVLFIFLAFLGSHSEDF